MDEKEVLRVQNLTHLASSKRKNLFCQPIMMTKICENWMPPFQNIEATALDKRILEAQVLITFFNNLGLKGLLISFRLVLK